MSEELIAQVTLCQIPYIGPQHIRQLISHAGSAHEALKLSKGKLTAIPGIGPKLAHALHKHRANIQPAYETIKTCKKFGVRMLFFTHEDYPLNLKKLIDSPPLLFSLGLPIWKDRALIAIVGTREMSDYGRTVVEQLITTIRPTNAIVLSGLAYGVDVAAHRQALKQGLASVAVLGHGLDRVYPPAHQTVARKMCRSGGLISELEPGTKPDAFQFPKRNRIIAGLADVLVVVEARDRGGALITAKQASDYKRPVYAVPGPIYNGASQGCHQLIRAGTAQLLEHPEVLLSHLDPLTQPSLTPTSSMVLSKPQQKLLRLMQAYRTGIELDTLSRLSGISINRVATLLLELEFKNIVKALPGKKFVLTPNNSMIRHV